MADGQIHVSFTIYYIVPAFLPRDDNEVDSLINQVL